MQIDRIPVLLLTGGLGSGKTTLLAAWLQQPELRDAAVVINEIGETALDDRLLRPQMQAADGAALLAGTCVCCEGLGGLADTLADLHRARLEQRIPRFDRVVVETTGLAEPQPIRALFADDAFLRERCRLEGVVTAVSAAAIPSLNTREEVQAQVAGADVLVVTKTDRAEASVVGELERVLRDRNPQAAIVRSARASLAAGEVLGRLAGRGSTPVLPAFAHRHEHHDHDHEPGHVHAADSRFVPLPHRVPRALLARRLQHCVAALGPELLRLKGLVLAEDGQAVTVQWSPGDEEAILSPFGGNGAKPGLTVITSGRERTEEAARLLSP
jgi:G3E family GTPase